jgi:hypothetical protein
VTEEAKQDNKPETPSSRFGAFLQKYATLLSSTVLGIAGLAATSMWQCRQSATTSQQASAQQRVAEMQAENSWKIERADILSKNIATLASNAPDSAEQRYGVLLSLTRGNLIDPELAVSYALELGKGNAEYMQSVLATVGTKDYARIARGFTVSCEDRYGVAPAIEACTDKLAARSAALAQVISDDTEATLGTTKPSPMALLGEERQVQLHIQRMTALFTPYLMSLYEDRKWEAMDRFILTSPGAHLVAALVLCSAKTGEFITDQEANQIQLFDKAQSAWLTTYLLGPACDTECKSRTLAVMVSHFAEADGSFDEATRRILHGPRAQANMAISFLHTRLLWCQVDPTDAAALRDRVLVPLATAALADPKAEPAVRTGLLSLVLLLDEPAADDADATAAWQKMTAAIAKAGAEMAQEFEDRRAFAATQRKTPPPKLKKLNFCAAPAQPTEERAAP